MGFQYSIDERWWRNGVDVSPATVAQWVIDSDAFKNFVQLEHTTTVRRICIWLGQKGHVFMVVWERGLKFDVIYFADSFNPNPFRQQFLTAFSEKLSVTRRESAEPNRKIMDRFSKSLFSCSEVECSTDFACVSFMARCTVYLNTMDIFLDGPSNLKCILHHADVQFHKSVYRKFEDALFTCLSDNILGNGEHPDGKCVWFSNAMNKRFVNINDVHLIVFDPTIEEPDHTANIMEFTDVNNPFKARQVDSEVMDLTSGDVGILINPDKGGACTLCSKFDQPLLLSNNHPSSSSFHLCSALSVLRECKDLLSSASSTIRRCLDSSSI
jgi:hypothetical protein